MKLLYITSLSGKRINNFMLSSILASTNLKIDYLIVSNEKYATNEFDSDCKDLHIEHKHFAFQRNPFNPINILQIISLNKFIKNNSFDFIHCNTPIGGIMGRICGKINGIKVIYMAHGFHFWKNSPLLNWLIYFPVERILSRFTDAIVTINTEDYLLAEKRLRCKTVYKIPGVGIPINDYINNKEKDDLRIKYGIPRTDIVLLSVGELSKRKNHKIIIDMFIKYPERTKKWKYMILGEGKCYDFYNSLIKQNNLEKCISLLGFKKEVRDYLILSDVFIFPSLQEGLPLALLEAMEAGLPSVSSNIRGNNDLIIHGENGFLIEDNDSLEYLTAIEKIVYDENIQQTFSKNSKQRVLDFSIERSTSEIQKIYATTVGENYLDGLA